MDSEKLQENFESNRLNWFGHVMRMDEHRLSKKVTELKIKENLEDLEPDGRMSWREIWKGQGHHGKKW